MVKQSFSFFEWSALLNCFGILRNILKYRSESSLLKAVAGLSQYVIKLFKVKTLVSVDAPIQPPSSSRSGSVWNLMYSGRYSDNFLGFMVTGGAEN